MCILLAAAYWGRLSRFESDLRWSADSLGEGSGVGWRRDAPVRPHAYLCEIGKTSRASEVGGRTTTATRWKSARERGWEGNLGMKDDGRGSWRSGKQTEKSVETDPEGKE